MTTVVDSATVTDISQFDSFNLKNLDNLENEILLDDSKQKIDSIKKIKSMSRAEVKEFVKNIDTKLYKNDKSSWRKVRKVVEKATEKLLIKDTERKGLYPIKYQGIWDFYNLHLRSHWVAKEVDLAKDKNDWNALNDDERHYLKWILAFFASSDFLVNENQEKDSLEAELLEHKFFNDDKMARENIHSTSYADLLEVYVDDDEEREFLKGAVTNIESVKEKARWFREYIENGTFVERLVATAIMEGIFFSGSFCGIFWMRKRGKLPGLCDMNEFIARDEGIHRDYACYLYREIVDNPFPNDILIDMIDSSVKLEQKFVTESLPVNLIGMNNDMMSQYVEYVADHLFFNLVKKQYYNVTNPFDDWLSAILLKIKADFFATRPTSYSDQKTMATSEENSLRSDDFDF